MKTVGDAIAKPPHYASDPRKGGRRLAALREE